MITASAYTSDLDTPSNKQFVAGMVRDTAPFRACTPPACTSTAWSPRRRWKTLGGKTDDKEALIKAMRAVSLEDSPRGPFHFDHFGNVVGNVYIRRVVKQDGKLAQHTIKTYPNVSQFWTFDEKWFLAQPVYSRDYPPLKS